MKTKLSWFFVALMGLLFVTVSFAQAPETAAPAASVAGITADQIVQWLTPLLVPLILAGVKQVGPKLPTWVIPLAAPVLGVVLDFLNSLLTSHASNFWYGAALGLLGVAVREVKEAIVPAKNGGWPVVPPNP